MLASSLSTLSSVGAPPTLDALFPAGARIGAETAISVDGKFDPWPCGVWCSASGIVLEPDKGKKGQLTVSIPKDIAPGPVLIRLYNAEGASDVRTFVIGALPEHTENSAHVDTLENPEPVEELPVTINGRLDKSGDIDIYRVPLVAGDTLVARVDGYALRSGIDPYLHLYDPGGVPIALGNDNGRNLDPLLIHEVAKTGDYLVAVMAYVSPPGSDIRFTGSKKAVYRLTLTTDPGALPAAPPDSAVPDPLTPPVALDATIAERGETNRYTFPAKKGDTLLVRVRAQEFGSPLDPVLTLTDAKGKTLRSVDDAEKTTRDAEYLLKIPADGDYTAAVSDRFGKGSPRHRYRIEIASPEPGFTVTVDKTSYVIEPAKSVDIKLKLTRLHGHAAPLEVEVENLPAGVTFDQPKIPDKPGSITLKLDAAKDAPPAGSAITVRLAETGSGEFRSRDASFSFQDDEARGPYLIDRLSEIWLTVKAAK